MAEDVLTQDPPYRKKVYDLLKSKFSDFKRTEEEFYKQLDTDTAYADKVYGVLSQNFSDFNRPKEEFVSMLGKPVAPSPQQPPAQRVGGGGAAPTGSGGLAGPSPTPSGAGILTEEDRMAIRGLPALDKFGVAQEPQRIIEQVHGVQREMGLDPVRIAAEQRDASRIAERQAKAQRDMATAQEGLVRISGLPKDTMEWAEPPRVDGLIQPPDQRWSRIKAEYDQEGTHQFSPSEIAARKEAGTWGQRDDAREYMRAFDLQQKKINERGAQLRKTYDALSATRDLKGEGAALEQEGAALERERAVLEQGSPTQQQVDAYNTKVRSYQQRQQAFADLLRPIEQEGAYLDAWQAYVTQGLTNAEAIKSLDPRERERIATQIEANANDGTGWAGTGYTGTIKRFFTRLGGNIAGSGLRLMNLVGNIPNRAIGNEDYYSPFAYLADQVYEEFERIDAEKPSYQKTDIFSREWNVNPGFLHKMLDGVLYAGTLAAAGAQGGVRGMSALGMVGSSEDYYREGVESGLKPQDAEIVALLLSGSEASIEALNLGPFVNGNARKSIMRGAVDAIKKGAAPRVAAKESFARYVTEQAGAEAGEEVMTSVAQAMVKKGAEVATGVDQDTELTAKGLAGDALMGAAIGGVMGSVGRLSQRPLYKEGVAWAVQNAAEFRQYVAENVPKAEQGPILERFELYESVYRGLPKGMKADARMTVAHAVAEKERLKKEQSATVVDETVAAAIGDMNAELIKEQDGIIADALGVDLVDLARKAETERLQEQYDKAKLKSEVTGKPMPEGMVRPESPVIEEAPTAQAPPGVPLEDGAEVAKETAQDASDVVDELRSSKENLNKRAAALGVPSVRQFNTQNVLNENPSDEQRQLLSDYAAHQNKVKGLGWADAAKLDAEDFGTWAKVRLFDKVRTLADLAAAQDLALAYRQRGLNKEADAAIGAIRDAKKRTDWTPKTWRERHDEEITQQEADAKNVEGVEFNKSVDEALDLIDRSGVQSPTPQEDGTIPVGSPTEIPVLTEAGGGEEVRAPQTKGEDGAPATPSTPTKENVIQELTDKKGRTTKVIPVVGRITDKDGNNDYGEKVTFDVTRDGNKITGSGFVYNSVQEFLDAHPEVSEEADIEKLRELDQEHGITRIVVTEHRFDSKTGKGGVSVNVITKLGAMEWELRATGPSPWSKQTPKPQTTPAAQPVEPPAAAAPAAEEGVAPIADIAPEAIAEIDDVLGITTAAPAAQPEGPVRLEGTPEQPKQQPKPKKKEDASATDGQRVPEQQAPKRTADEAVPPPPAQASPGVPLEDAGEVAKRELWQKTRAEVVAENAHRDDRSFIENNRAQAKALDEHKAAVEKAFADGEDVSAEVLAAYPHLKPKKKEAVAGEGVKEEVPIKDLPRPPFRDWRISKTYHGSVTIVPNKVGGKFTDEQIDALGEWAKENGLIVHGRGPTKLNVHTRGSRSMNDFGVHGAAGVASETAAAKKAATKKAEADRDVEEREYLDKSPAWSWAKGVFGEDAMNTYNAIKLADFLDGKDKKFGGLVGRSWIDGLEKLDALPADGQPVDFQKIKDAYSTAQKEVATATDERQPAKKQEEPPKTQAGWKREGAKPVDKSAPIADIPITKNAKDAGVKEAKEYAIKGFEEYPVVVVREAKGYRAFVKVGDVEVNISSGHPTEGIVVGDATEMLGRVGKEKLDATVERAIAAQKVKEEGPREQRAPARDQAFNGPEQPKTPIGDTKTVMVDGKERTVFNSNGKPIHPTVEGVRNFWRWFGDSKVVDKEGRPLVVYHGGRVENEFRTDKIQIGGGFFFTPSKQYARMYASKTLVSERQTLDIPPSDISNRIKAVYLKSNPIPNNGISAAISYRAKEAGISFNEQAKIEGYDGSVLLGGKEISVWTPTQIKSATGNYGTFDPSKPSILEQRPTDRAPKTGKPNTDKVIKALADFGVKVVAPRTKQEYQKAIEQFPDSVKSSWGLYDHATRTIYINPDSKDIPNTLFHEAAHPILTALFHNNPTLRDKFFGEIADENMPGAVDADGNPVDMTYREYGAKYADKSIAMRYEEAIAQFAADVTDGKVKVSLKPDSLWQKFKAFIQEILAALGWDTRSIDLSKPDNVRAFAAQFKKAMDKGIRITGLTPAEGTTLSLQDDADRLVDGWYSRLDQAVAAKGSTMPASQWKKWLEARAKEGMLSLEESKWTGLDDFLAGKGDEKVTPQQVREFLKENRVKVEVVEKNDGGFVHKSAWSAEPRMPGEWEVYDHTGASVMRNVVADSADEAVSIAFEEYPDDAKERSDTKFSQYQLPGASNYREVLVLLHGQTLGEKGARRRSEALRMFGLEYDALSAAQQDEIEKSVSGPVDEISYSDPHFGSRTLVHLRLNARTGPNGEKILFIEELQSDWGQQGKKKGFGGTEQEQKRLKDRSLAIRKEMSSLTKIGKAPSGEFVIEVGYDPAGTIYVRNEDAFRWGELQDEYQEVENKIASIERSAVPASPFVTSTDAWVELGMKQAIRMAVQGGYDRVAWSTGEQQFNRWGSQAFAWSKGKTGWRIVGKEQIGGEAFAGMEEALAQEAKESDTIITSKEELRDVVEDVMGRERSDYSPEKWKTHINKMVDGMWERMQNEDSGTTMPRREGMKGFYDKILPAVAKKVSKKLGGDGVVSDTMIGEDQQVGDEIGRQQSIAITPEMRARVGLGVPLMQRPKTTKAAEWNAAVDAATDLNKLLSKGEEQSILDAAELITDPDGKQAFIDAMNAAWGVTTPPLGTKANQKKVSKAYLRDELKKAVEAGKRAGIADVAKARKEFVARIKEALSKDNFRGELSAAQARVITTRAARVNPLNPKIVDRFIAYAERVAADATYAEQMERVRIAQRGATRRNHAQFQSAVNDFLRIDPEAIPEEMMRDYMEAVADMSKPVPSYRAMQDMFYPLMQATRRDDNPKAPPSVGDVETLWETMKQRQVNSFEDYKAMLSDIGRLKTAMRRLSENDKADTQEVEKLIKEIETALAEFEQRFAEDIAFMKERLVEDIVSRAKGIDLTNITEETKALLKQAYELSDAELMGLSPDELVTLSDILDNVEVDGYVDVFRLDPILAKAQARSAAPGINEQIEKAKDIKSQDKRVERMSTKDAAFWEAAIGLGRIAKGAFHQYLVAPLQRAAGDYIKQVQDGRGFFSKLKKKHGINEKALDRIGMMAVYLREYALRFDPALAGKKDDDGMEYGKRDWFNKILKDGDDSVYGPALWRRMQKAYEALPKDADGQVDPQAVYDAYVNETGAFLPKNEVAFLKEAMAWNAENLTGKQRTANYLRGKPFNELMFHVYRKRIDRKKSKDAIEDAPFVLGDNGNVRIASATGKEVTDNSIAPIAFNYEQLFDANLENVARDYHFTPAMRRMNAVMGAVRAEGGKRAKQYMDVAGRNIQDAMNNEFVHGRRDFFDKGVSNLLAAKAKMVFITPFRTLYESIAGYLSYGMRAGTMRGYAQPFKDNAIVMDLMDAVRSPLRNRKNLSKFIEIEKGAMKERGFFEKVTHTFASATEGVLLKPIWYARFQDEFADITGKEFDAKRWKDDEGYRYDNRKAIDRAAVVADAAYEAIVGSTTAAGNRRNIDVGLGKMKAKTTRGRLASFMTGYAYREWLQIADATLGMVQLMKDEGAAAAVSKRGRRLAGGAVGVLVSATTYNFLMELHYAVMNLLSADDDEEKNLALAELDALLSWEGSLREMGTGFTSIAASKYSGAGRQFIKGIGSIMYNSTTDPEKREAIRSLVRNISFQNPYDLPLKNYQDKDGMYRSIAEAIPAVQTAVENFIMLKRSAVIAHEAATDDKEQSDWEESVIAATVIVNGFNALAQFFGGAAPSTLLNRLTTRYSVDGAERQVRKYAAAYSNAKTPQEKEEAEKVLNDWIRTQPEEDRKTLVRAARESIKLHGVDPWYILLRRVQSPEDRAEAAWSKMKGMTPEERKEAVATMKRVGGIATDRFIARYKELEAEEGEK